MIFIKVNLWRILAVDRDIIDGNNGACARLTRPRAVKWSRIPMGNGSTDRLPVETGYN